MRVCKILRIDGLPHVRRDGPKGMKLASLLTIVGAIVLAWVGRTSGENQPNLTTVETWGETQIKVTWKAFEQDGHEPYHYELYIDDHLEYFGNDLMYVARRLTPDTVYHFKLRSCSQRTKKCSRYSETMSGTTAISKKRGVVRSFFQWSFVWLVVTTIACLTAVIGMKIYRKLWKSFLYRHDYKSETEVAAPKHWTATDVMDDDVALFSIKTSQRDQDDKNITSVLYEHPQNEDHLEYQKLQEDEPAPIQNSQQHKRPTVTTQSLSIHPEHSKTTESNPTSREGCRSEEIFENQENFKKLVNSENKETSENEDNSTKKIYSKNKKNLKGIHFRDPEETLITAEPLCNNEFPKTESKDDLVITSSPANRVRHMPDKNKLRSSSFDDHVKTPPGKAEKCSKPKNLRYELVADCKTKLPAEDAGEIVVVVDNSNIFIGAQECASLVNPKERRRNIRVKIQQLVKVFERGRPLARAFVQGSSPPTTEQVWEVYRRLGYCVDLEERRGKDEQRVDEGLHLHIYKALCELSPRKLVIASGDGNKGKSEGSTSLPGCAQVALEKGWFVEVHSWQHSLSTEWLKLSRKYPVQLSIHYLDRYMNHITFVDGKHGRKCQPFPTDFFRSM